MLLHFSQLEQAPRRTYKLVQVLVLIRVGAICKPSKKWFVCSTGLGQPLSAVPGFTCLHGLQRRLVHNICTAHRECDRWRLCYRSKVSVHYVLFIPLNIGYKLPLDNYLNICYSYNALLIKNGIKINITNPMHDGFIFCLCSS